MVERKVNKGTAWCFGERLIEQYLQLVNVHKSEIRVNQIIPSHPDLF